MPAQSSNTAMQHKRACPQSNEENAKHRKADNHFERIGKVESSTSKAGKLEIERAEQGDKVASSTSLSCIADASCTAVYWTQSGSKEVCVRLAPTLVWNSRRSWTVIRVVRATPYSSWTNGPWNVHSWNIQTEGRMVSKERRAKRQHQVHVSEVIASVNNSSSIEIEAVYTRSRQSII